jgi:tetratricopeptide (TPR) repeat protein
MESHPDSALKILKGVRTIQLIKPSDKALYALLMSQALDKNDIKLESDSLISIATNYYDDKEPVRAGYAWFYLARCANNRGNAEVRASALLKAQEFAEGTTNFWLLGLIYSDKAEMYRSQMQNDSSITLNKKALKAFLKTPSRYNCALTANNIGTEYRDIEKFDSSLIYLNFAEKIARPLNNNILTANIYKSFGNTALAQKNREKALRYYHMAPLTHIDEYDFNRWYLMGKAFSQLNKFDSASYYLSKVKNTFKFGVDYYSVWEAVYEKQKNYKMSLFYYQKVIQAKDSLRQLSLKNSFAGMEKKYNYEHLAVENKTLIIQNKQRGIIVLLSLLTLSIFFLTLFYWRFKAKKRQLIIQQELNEKEKALFEKERDNNQLLQRQTNMQHFLLKNVEQYSIISKKEIISSKGVNKAPSTAEKAEEHIIALANAINHNISTRLAEKFPQLTKRDILICCMLLEDFDTGMIATFFNVKNDSIIIHRGRLRKKLSLTNDENLIEHLLNF